MATQVSQDPIQGFDVDVTVRGFNGPILIGRFTSILVRLVNVTETYLELNERMPRHLDGEVNIVWQMERGMLNMGAVEETFNFFVGANVEIARGQKIPRAARFSVQFVVSIDKAAFSDSYMADLNGQYASNNKRTTYILNMCKVDTMSFGATSGRNIVANQWQGTSEGFRIS